VNRLAWTLAAAALVGCNEHPLVEVELVRTTDWVAGAVCSPAPTKVDVLLVVDDSPSMVEEAEAVASGLRAIGEVYEQTWLDYRIAVVSTHVSGPDCGLGDDGEFIRTSCLDRIEDFVSPSSHEAPSTDARDACRASCSGSIEPVPWVERIEGVHNVDDPVQHIVCMGQVGFHGCEAESPMMAALRALERAADPDDPNYGFLRPDAGLSIVFIGDEDDCSRPEGATEPLRGRTVSTACWDAAVNDGPLLSLEVFEQRLRAVEVDKQRRSGIDGQRVFVSAVAGVPDGYPEVPLRYETDGSWFEEAFGVAPGCSVEGRHAAPPLRTLEAAEAFPEWVANVVSSCSDDWWRALACLPSLGDDDWNSALLLDDAPLGERVGEETLREACIATVDGEVVEECGDRGTEDREPVCVRWRLRDDLRWEAVFQWNVARWGQACIEVTCATHV